MQAKTTFKERLTSGYWSLGAMFASLMVSITPVLAADNTIWTQISNAVKDVYGQILGISTLIAVTAAAFSLIDRMISRHQRAAVDATSWLKRIVITWIILNTQGSIIAYLQCFMTCGQYTFT